MNKRKIAIIIERAEASLGGAERSVFELSEALSSAGLDVHILAAKGITENSVSTPVHFLADSLPGKRVDFLVFTKILEQHLAENHYDIIHSFLPFDFADIYQPRSGSYPEAIFRNAASCANPVLKSFKIITACANTKRTVLQKAEKKLCENPDGPLVAALSQYVAQQFKKYYSLSDNRIAVIPNGVKVNITPVAIDTYALRSRIFSQFNIKENENSPIFLFAANNFRLKGLTNLIKAIRMAVSNNNPCYLLVVGSDNPSKYLRLAGKQGIEKYISFVGSVSDINPLIQICDAAVLPTYYDPSSRFVLEALAAGKPVITTRFNGACDLFTGNRHGIILENPGDIKSLADALRYFSDKENARKASNAIIAENLKDNISIERVARQLIELYEKIISKRGQKC